MKTKKRNAAMCVVVAAMMIFTADMNAQNSAPAPGQAGGGTSAMAPGTPVMNHNPANGIGWNPGPALPPPDWGGPMVVNTPMSTPSWQDNGIMNVMACGYDAQGIWRVLPLRISYDWNGVCYNVLVINAWNPWTDTWNLGVNMPAYNTSYYLNGQNYDFYTPLTTGTYYFNL